MGDSLQEGRKRRIMAVISRNEVSNLPERGNIGHLQIILRDRLYRFTDKEILGQVKSPGISVELDGSDLGWDLDIPESGMFLSGFRVYKNDTEGNMIKTFEWHLYLLFKL